jgi:hypothetical protein
MRRAEWINLLYFSSFTVLAWCRPLAKGKRFKATAIGASGLAATVAGAFLVPRILPPLAASVTRDWLPAVLLLMAYWQGGQFFTHADERLQRKLEGLDRRAVLPVLKRLAAHRFSSWMVTYLEIAYLSCYAVVPMSLATLYILRMGRYSDDFWASVLSSTYACYAMLPFFQTLPPRMLEAALPVTPVRRFNLLVLRHGSIHVNTFPSGHVVSSTACALAVLQHATWPGLALGWIALSIASGAVLGRYHYLADALAGAAVAVVVFLLFA